MIREAAYGKPYRVTFDCTATSEDAFTEAAIAHLRGRGYEVSEPHETWETPSAFLARLRLSKNRFRPLLAEWERRGHKIGLDRGEHGRIRELLSNAAFDAFCRRKTDA